MPEPVYSVKLFYGDMKFSNDYSNVLQFNTKELRDAYFDGLSSTISINNTETNRVLFDGGSIKLAIPLSDLPNLDKINYAYINFALLDGNSFVQYRKYYFVTSYEIISSNEGVTVVGFMLEYDVWQNNQFDFTLRESNIERMHVDRWESNTLNVKYTRPVLDAIESNMKIDKKYQIEDDVLKAVKYHGSAIAQNTNVMWVMVTALHTFGKNIDQMLYHFFPVTYKDSDLTFSEDNPAYPAYYTQNAIQVGEFTQSGTNVKLYFPSLQSLDSAYLAYACGNDVDFGSSKDVVKVLNVQLFNWMPFNITYETKEFGGQNIEIAVIKLYNNVELKLFAGVPNFVETITGQVNMFASYAVGDLSVITKAGNTLIQPYTYTGISKPSRPSNNANYSPNHEPALFMNPIRKRYITMGDVSASGEIPDILYIKEVLNTTNRVLVLREKISFSAMSAYCYFYIGLDRISSNTEGFSLIKPSYLGDIISDAWQDYVVQQRDSDRAMMWTNIMTGGLSEAGSTAVSAGIGWRSNMERAYSMQNTSSFIKSQQIHTGRTGNKEKNQYYKQMRTKQLIPTSEMYGGMAKNAMLMSGLGGVTAFSANAIHQAMAQRNKEMSIQNKPGTLAKAGNAIGAIIDNQFKLYYIETVVDDTAFEKYKILFMKYGYYIGTVELPNINSRKYFNYIKTNGAIVTGSCNNLLLSYIANIFDSGVTIWHMDYTTYSTIYDYTKENIERSLI